MIVYCCADLIFATRIRSTAEDLGIVTRPVRSAEMLAARLNRVNDGKPNDPVDALFIDLDTGDTGLALIEQAKAADAPPTIIAFGSHVAVDMLTAAKQKGADATLPRSAFTANLIELLKNPTRI